MTRLIISTAFLAAANAIGLIVANLMLDDMSLTVGAFILDVAIFTAISAIIRPFLIKIAVQNFEALLGGTALIATLIGLIVTSVLSDGLQISGTDTWLLATIIIWLVSLGAGVLLPMLFLKRGVQAANERRTNAR